MSSSFDVIVIGAGVLGLASAAELSARGLTVVVVDPGGPNASSVAAGMIAPAMEAAQDDLPAAVVEVLKAARALWPTFAARNRLQLIEDGADWRGPGSDEVEARLTARGFESRRTATGLHVSNDARVDVAAALREFGRKATMVTGVVRAVVREAGGWTASLADGRTLGAYRLVLATGVAAAIEGLPSRVAALVEAVTPIRGQLAFVPGVTATTVVRTPAGYAAPVQGGMLIGASMDVGRRDLAPDAIAARNQLEAVRAMTGLPPGEPEVRVGVRGALPDGLPAVGSMDGVVLALAPRRNGWLLAPLVALLVADAVQGRPPGPHAAALGPDRPGVAPS